MTGGAWTTGDVLDPATRPGAYFNLVAQAVALIGEGVAGTVAVIGRSDWGPVDEFTELETEAAITSTFGNGLSLAKLAKQAIRGGAGTVKLLRITGTTEAAASVTLDDSVPAAALTLTAKYPGARGNDFNVTVEANPISGTDLKLFEGTVLLETFTADNGHNDEFAALVNATDGSGSRFLTATVDGADGTVVADVANSPLSGGDSGATVVAGDYTDAQALAEQESFTAIVQDDEADTAIQDALVTWAQDARVNGSRFITVLGSETGDALSAALARTATIDNEGIVYVFPGFTDTDGVFYKGQEAAARVAGLIAAAGVTRSITFNRIDGGASVEVSLTNTEISQGLAGGLLMLRYDGTEVAVEKGINTLTSLSTDKPLAFTKIRTIVVLDAVQNGLDSGLRQLVGQVNNDDDGRATVLGAAQAYLDTLTQARALKPGAFVELDPEFNQEGENLFLRVALTPLDSIEKIFVTVYVSAS